MVEGHMIFGTLPLTSTYGLGHEPTLSPINTFNEKGKKVFFLNSCYYEQELRELMSSAHKVNDKHKLSKVPVLHV